MQTIHLTIGDDANCVSFELRHFTHDNSAELQPVKVNLDLAYGLDNLQHGYIHLDGDRLPSGDPTEAQRALLARIYLARDDETRWTLLGLGLPIRAPEQCRKAKTLRPLFGERPPTLGRSVCEWAFRGMNPQQVSDRYGAGATVYLNGPGGEREPAEPADRTTYHKEQDY